MGNVPRGSSPLPGFLVLFMGVFCSCMDLLPVSPTLPRELFQIDPDQKCAGEIGIVLLPGYQALGYGKEIFRKFMEFGFGTLHLHRVFGKCDEGNVASARLMEQCGMKYEGTIREHVWLRDHWRSTRYYGMLDREYGSACPTTPPPW